MCSPSFQGMLTCGQKERIILVGHSCQPANQLRNKWPFGIDGLMKIFQAHADNRLMALFVRLYHHHGDTFEHTILGSRGFATINPLNLEAILSKQFDGEGLNCLKTQGMLIISQILALGLDETSSILC